MNTIRKHVSTIKGGRLAAAAYPAKVVSLVVSDIPGDNPALVASGPTIPDAGSRADALGFVAAYRHEAAGSRDGASEFACSRCAATWTIRALPATKCM